MHTKSNKIPIIKISNITFKYHNLKQPIFNNLSLDIYQGEYICLLGHNGSGKSALAKIINGLEKPSHGKIEVLGTVLQDETIYKIREDVSLVFQNPETQFVGITVEDDIAFGLENHNINPKLMKDIILGVLDKLQMRSFLKRSPYELSGGQKQKIAIAGILALSPKIIIFDEATSMLDDYSKNEIFKIMADLNNNHDITIISITHNMESTITASRIIVLKNGKIMVDKPPVEILFNTELLNSLGLKSPQVAIFSNLLYDQKIISKKSLNLNEVLKWL